MAIELRILKASVTVQEAQELYVQWTRNGQSAKTKKLSVDQQVKVAEFARSQANFSMNPSFLINESGDLLPDINKLQLFCAGQLVGTCSFDMSVYKGKNPVPERASIADEATALADTSKKHLIGDPVANPDAFIEFRISLQDKAAASKQKNISSASSAMSSRSSIKTVRQSSLQPI